MLKKWVVVLCGLLFWCSFSSASGEEQKPSQPVNTLKKELSTRFDVSQISFTNWAKGGDNTITYNIGLIVGMRKDAPRYSWYFHGDFSFGQTKQGDRGVRNTLDRIDVDASVTFKKKKFMNPYFLLSLDTQFARGYNYKTDPPTPKSDFWDPAYLVQSFGSGVQFNQVAQTKLGIAVKETFTRNFRSYSDHPDTPERKEWVKIEPGVNSRTDFSFQFNHRMKVESKLELFSNLSTFEEIDLRWDSKFQAKLAKYISLNLSIYALYDSNDSRKTQVKQFLGIGFVYNFF